MSSVVVRAEGLGKKYLLAHEQGSTKYVALRDEIAQALRNATTGLRRAFGASRAKGPQHIEDFWALRDVNFEIRKGEIVGIIGRNGAGKSTLLKILSRITDPTEGRVIVDGRVASLLEVGTGFHSELTGRENIFLNGAILGMARDEIRRKFDSIVAFADVERFLDTPVKRYSTGMQVRLAFAVAAHLEPDILVIDEVLAVGDAEFQKKCLGKMSEVAHGGRTVFFVSHNMSAVQSLCGRGILLQSGSIFADGPVNEVVHTYVSALEQAAASSGPVTVPIGTSSTLTRLAFGDGAVRSGSEVPFVVELSSTAQAVLYEMSILIYSELGVRVAILDLRHVGIRKTVVPLSGLTISGTVTLPLVEGRYRLGIWVVTPEGDREILDVAVLSVLPRADAGDRDGYPADYRGLIDLPFSGEVRTGP